MFADPVKNLKALGLKEDAIVADLGAGTGYYSIALGKLIPNGKVYAVEVVKDFLTTVKNKAIEAGLKNVEIIWGNVEKIGGTSIKDGILDACIASNILFQVEDKDKFIKETARILKPKGRVLLVDWSSDSELLHAKHAIPKTKAREMFEKGGFMWASDIDAGAHHYGMILTKE